VSAVWPGPLPIRRASEERLQWSAFAWIGAAVVMVAIPHVRHMPLWISVLSAAAIGYRLLIERLRWRPPPRWLLVILVVVAGFGILAHYRTIAGRDAGVALLLAMSSLKFLESKTQRDATLMVFLAYFLVATNFLYTQTIPTALYMMVTTVVITAALITLNQKGRVLSVVTRLKLAGIIIAQSVPVMLILFILVPRIPGPIWGLTDQSKLGVTGLSEEMTPGAISDLIRSSDVAFRVRFVGQVPSQKRLYWRGPVLWSYDGRTWTGRREARANRSDMAAFGDAYTYIVILEPHNHRWLYALDVPTDLSRRASLSQDYQLVTSKPVTDMLMYRATSQLDYVIGAAEDDRALEMALAWPAGFNPRTKALGEDLRERYQDPARIVEAALQFFREQEFVYTLRPPLLGRDAMDEFLFESRQGFCEHYASAFVLLMRAAGVPARVVTGYQGGESNPMGNYLIVRQSDAHAWAEVWMPQTGWTRVDPTAAVSPSRVEQGIYEAIGERELLPFQMRKDFTLLRRASLAWDALNNTWNEWVLGYGTFKQLNFLTNLGVGIRNWGDMIIALTLCLVVLFGSYFLAGWYRARPRSVEPVRRLYERFCSKLSRVDLPRDPFEGPSDFARRAGARRADLKADIERITRLYVRLRYGRSGRGSELAELRRLVRAFRP
jgi:transglutaminase-like putative cysteine protease